MKNLQDILYKVSIAEVHGTTDREVLDIHQDSRECKKDSLFIAISGIQSNGHDFIEKAIDFGASVIICEQMPAQFANEVTYVKVSDSRISAGIIAHNFFDKPSEKLRLVGITGTNGKTTIATLLYTLFAQLGRKAGLLSTIENRIGDEVIRATHTTPDVVSVHRLLSKMAEAECEVAFMEVSSHAVDQNRIAGLYFSGGVFTNLTRDHLDYHKTFKSYLLAKKKFFDGLGDKAFSLVNQDDKNGLVMMQNTKSSKHTYGLQSMAKFKSKILESDFSGLFLNMDGIDVYTKLIGDFNAQNLTAVYATAILLGEEKEDVLLELSKLTGAAGRFDYMISSKLQIIGIVDYAHTPDALEKVLQTISKIRTGKEQLITLVGCGGNRDSGKRPLMGQIASELSNRVILTSDNPRNEDPEIILDEMEEGIRITDRKKVLRIQNRKEAIRTACTLANANDIILLAGKGHEDYQEIKGERFPFDDKAILFQTLKELDK